MKKLNKLNKLEALAIMTAHLLKQKRRSMLPDQHTCAYRGENGLKCAVGALIPDSLYHSDMECCLAGSHIIGESLQTVVDFKANGMTSLLARVQQIHDTIPVLEWEYELQCEKLKLVAQERARKA